MSFSYGAFAEVLLAFLVRHGCNQDARPGNVMIDGLEWIYVPRRIDKISGAPVIDKIDYR